MFHIGIIFIITGTTLAVPMKAKPAIINGLEASLGQFPFIVSFRNRYNKHFCGGTIIGNQWVLTAAHCFDSFRKEEIVVYAGTTTTFPDDGTSFSIETIFIYPHFRPFFHDLALVKLKNVITWTRFIQPAKISTVSHGTRVLAAGWGALVPDGGTTSPFLMYLPMITTSDCLSDFLVCTVPLSFGGICFGDSGGPLVTKGGNLVGISSFVINGCGDGYPDSFTKVANYINWINSIIKQN